MCLIIFSFLYTFIDYYTNWYVLLFCCHNFCFRYGSNKVTLKSLTNKRPDKESCSFWVTFNIIIVELDVLRWSYSTANTEVRLNEALSSSYHQTTKEMYPVIYLEAYGNVINAICKHIKNIFTDWIKQKYYGNSLSILKEWYKRDFHWERLTVQIVQFATFLDINWYVNYKVVWIINKFWEISKPGTVVTWSNKTRKTTSCHVCKQGHKQTIIFIGETCLKHLINTTRRELVKPLHVITCCCKKMTNYDY